MVNNLFALKLINTELAFMMYPFVNKTYQ
jgi:hypothetical protein